MANSKEKRKFAWVKEKYSLAEKKKLGELIVKYKDNDKELKNLEGKTHYDCKRKSTYRWNQNKSLPDNAGREFYTDLSQKLNTMIQTQ